MKMAVLAVLLPTCIASAGERDDAWNALVAAAKARGAAETRLDRSASYVLQQADGSYISLTRQLKTDRGRSVCLIAKDENATVCVDWATSKLTLGARADAATPWSFKSFASLEDFEAAQPTWFERLRSTLGYLNDLSKPFWSDDVIVIRRQ